MKEDHEIIELYWARSESAVHETDEKYGAKLHTLSGRILPEAEDAEECVNDTYLGAWNAMPPQRPLALFAFLARICRNIACDKLDRLRAKKRSAEVSALTEELSACIADPTAAREAESREIAEALNSFLSTLPRRCPALFHAPLLVYGFRKSYRRKVRLRRKPRQNVPPPHA